MSTLNLEKYGKLEGVAYLETYPDGSPKACTLDEKNLIKTPVGTLIPSYGPPRPRKRESVALEFFQNGNLKSIALNEAVEAKTSLGVLSVERISFYEDGNIHRFFPLNGQIDGYWSEEEEAKLATPIDFDLAIGTFSVKVISICFYESGSLKSLTLWPGESIELMSPDGLVYIRYGLALYEDGSLKSFEPARPEPINTPIGIVIAYDSNAHGVNGDENSVCYDEVGKIKSLMTLNSAISISTGEEKKIIKPLMKRGKIDPERFFPEPIKIEFSVDTIVITQDSELTVDLTQSKVKAIIIDDPETKACGNCSECSHCG
ncbi:hypothetical protein [Acetobacterium bakii]|uniref:Uncharacterized protein n=1 Tax=Acetobacterium bakii TaxID=52689 RepID=A0A0L6U0V7_9FIRM|nr:hypothetical protein [Acetobacterium bakii]KNZ41972.1 hypothetical protein AKG39_10210 [Acetobacterium bakii]